MFTKSLNFQDFPSFCIGKFMRNVHAVGACWAQSTQRGVCTLKVRIAGVDLAIQIRIAM